MHQKPLSGWPLPEPMGELTPLAVFRGGVGPKGGKREERKVGKLR